MKQFTFEYTNQKLLTKLFIIAFLTFFILLFSAVQLKNYIGFLPSFGLALLIPFLIVWLNRKKIKLIGFASIDNSSLELKLKSINEIIQYVDIKSYMVQIYNGTLLKLKLLNGQKIKIISNNTFCNPTEFTLFCADLELNLEKFQQETKSDLVREKSFFEKKSTFYFLIAMTIFIALALLFPSKHGSRNPGTLFMTIGSLLAMWSGYFAAKKKKN